MPTQIMQNLKYSSLMLHQLNFHNLVENVQIYEEFQCLELNVINYLRKSNGLAPNSSKVEKTSHMMVDGQWCRSWRLPRLETQQWPWVIVGGARFCINLKDIF